MIAEKISLVIPMLNEESALPRFFSALEKQSCQPAEIIFVDAGSCDKSRELVEAWGEKVKSQGIECRCFLLPGALPGGGRNEGCQRAKGSWVAFLDVGVYPEPCWLEVLKEEMEKRGADAVLGVCLFQGRESFSRAVSALSYGEGRVRPVLPASLFKKEVFQKVGGFDSTLRAAEDLEWLRRLRAKVGEPAVAWSAQTHYSDFPHNWKSLYRKWKSYGSSSLGAKRSHFPRIIVFALGLGILLLGWVFGALFFLSFFFFRAFFLPMLKSQKLNWWKRDWKVLFLAFPIGVVMEAGKLVGEIEALLPRKSFAKKS